MNRLDCPACGKAQNLGDRLEPGALVVCVGCLTVSQYRAPGPRLDRIDEASLSPGDARMVAEIRSVLSTLKN